VKTDDLVSLLSTDAETVDSGVPARRYLLALAGGTLVALVLTAGFLRLNPALWRETSEPMFWVRETYCAVLSVLGFVAVVRLARPGLRLGLAPAGIAVALIAMWALAGVTLAAASPQNRAQLIFGHMAMSAECPFRIALAAAPLFIAFIWAVRSLAPTRLHLTGAACGFAAGSIGALVYSLYCPELAAPFLGTWYLLGMLIPTTLGACLGSRLLRW
jgi:hypothetical protein